MIFRIDVGKEFQVGSSGDQWPASSPQRIIDLGKMVAHPGVLCAQIRSCPWVLGRIGHGVLAVGKTQGLCERVGK